MIVFIINSHMWMNEWRRSMTRSLTDCKRVNHDQIMQFKLRLVSVALAWDYRRWEFIDHATIYSHLIVWIHFMVNVFIDFSLLVPMQLHQMNFRCINFIIISQFHLKIPNFFFSQWSHQQFKFTLKFPAQISISTFQSHRSFSSAIVHTHYNFSPRPCNSHWSILCHFPLTPESIMKLQHMFLSLAQREHQMKYLKNYFRFRADSLSSDLHTPRRLFAYWPHHPRTSREKIKSQRWTLYYTANFSFSLSRHLLAVSPFCSMQERQPWGVFILLLFFSSYMKTTTKTSFTSSSAVFASEPKKVLKFCCVFMIVSESVNLVLCLVTVARAARGCSVAALSWRIGFWLFLQCHTSTRDMWEINARRRRRRLTNER